jgi:hypothetical protein
MYSIFTIGGAPPWLVYAVALGSWPMMPSQWRHRAGGAGHSRNEAALPQRRVATSRARDIKNGALRWPQARQAAARCKRSRTPVPGSCRRWCRPSLNPAWPPAPAARPTGAMGGKQPPRPPRVAQRACRRQAVCRRCARQRAGNRLAGAAGYKPIGAAGSVAAAPCDAKALRIHQHRTSRVAARSASASVPGGAAAACRGARASVASGGAPQARWPARRLAIRPAGDRPPGAAARARRALQSTMVDSIPR